MGKRMQRVLGGTALPLALLGCAGAAYVRSLDLDSQPLANARTTPAELSMLKGAGNGVREQIA